MNTSTTDNINELYFSGDLGDVITFSGSINSQVPSFDCSFKIHLGDAVIWYIQIDSDMFSAEVLKQSSVGDIEIDLVDSWIGGPMIPVVKVPFQVDAIKIESMTGGGKIDDVQYVVSDRLMLNERQLRMVESLKSFQTDDGVPLIKNCNQDSLIGFCYFNEALK